MTTIREAIDRVRAEYLEMPGMCLTTAQVERLCGIDQTICRHVLSVLVQARFLYVRRDGRYGRASEEQLPPVRMLPAPRLRPGRVGKAS